jgi:hypothetical protein
MAQLRSVAQKPTTQSIVDRKCLHPSNMEVGVEHLHEACGSNI